MSFYDKYIDLCMKAGEYPSVAAVKMGFHKSTVSSWKRRKTAPSDITLHTVANYFGVPVSYFSENNEKKTLIASAEKISSVIETAYQMLGISDEEDNITAQEVLEQIFANATEEEKMEWAARLISSLSDNQQAALIQRIMFKK